MGWNFPVSERKIQELLKRFDALKISEKDLQESFILGSGKGGQKVNKTHNGVDLLHLPSGCRVQCHKDRERSMNRFFARRLLADALERRKNGGQLDAETQKIEKIRKQKARRKRRGKNNTSSEM
jgi:protein subunit release factor B